MGGFNLEVFKFGMYVMFPIGIMYYFGTNLDQRFAVEGFWPKPEETNKVPHTREEIKAEYERIVARQRLLKEREAMRRAAAGQGPSASESS
ncbi:Protein PET100 mitochondrial [Ceratocystis lukuohia]|uniref:Protein PET100 mitochondrial n=3 Tax=Ceratocystis TaxID=5157 RepID=A0A0F8CZ96_CERFI|nr:Protein PET100 mitochondrial [Ceratocystis platani]PHH55433.1 Protein PET100, mitochondrial [Ceratocystis fimbriata CBS 114723]